MDSEGARLVMLIVAGVLLGAAAIGGMVILGRWAIGRLRRWLESRRVRRQRTDLRRALRR